MFAVVAAEVGVNFVQLAHDRVNKAFLLSSPAKLIQTYCCSVLKPLQVCVYYILLDSQRPG